MFYKRKSIILYGEYKHKTYFANILKITPYCIDFKLRDVYIRIRYNEFTQDHFLNVEGQGNFGFICLFENS